MNCQQYNRWWWLSTILFLISAIVVGFRSYNHEPISDDLLYAYILDDHPLGQNDYTEKIESISDAIKSQSTQYFYTNGRTIVHIFVQMFAGPWGYASYSVFLGFLIFAVLLLFTIYCTPHNHKNTFLLSGLIVIAFLYLFQNNSGLWYSIAEGFNYLFPILLVLTFLLTLNKVNEKKTPFWMYPIFSFLGFITGWSQECYSLPLSAALFIYIILTLKKRQRFSFQFWILVVSLWIGTAILFFAPGNFVRVSNAGLLGALYAPIKGIKFLGGTILFWLLILGIVILRIKNRQKFKDFINLNQVNILILVFSLLLGFVANSMPQSFNGVSFYSAILLFRLLDSLKFFRKPHFLISLLILIPVYINQIRIIQQASTLKHTYHAFVESYINSANGVVAIPELNASNDVSPFLENWFANQLIMDWRMLTLEKYYFNGKKRIYPLEPIDYKFYTNGFSDNVDMLRQGEKYLWIPISDVSKGDTVSIFFDNTDFPSETIVDQFKTKIKKLLKKETISKKVENPIYVIIEDSMIIKGQHDLIGINKEYEYKVIDYTIKPVQR